MTPETVLEFWFGPLAERDWPDEFYKARWFTVDPSFDEEVRSTFGEAIEAAGRGEYDSWCATPRGALAVVILLDQFTRNAGRGSGAMYTHDARAVKTATTALDAGFDADLAHAERSFLYMPLMHAEELGPQEACVGHFQRLAAKDPRYDTHVEFAIRHRDIVARFGRFPHRNALLGRTTTDEEAEFLTEPGSSF